MTIKGWLNPHSSLENKSTYLRYLNLYRDLYLSKTVWHYYSLHCVFLFAVSLF